MQHANPPAFDVDGDPATGELERLRSDLAERDRALADLLQSRRKHELLIEATKTGYVILDMNGRVLDANAEYVRLTGHQRFDEIIGRCVIEWTAEYDRERNAAEVRKCIEQGSVRDLVIRYVDTHGRVTPVEINATVLGTPASTTILTVCRDISDRLRAEQALRYSEEQYRSTIDSMSDLIHVVDSELRIVLMNRRGRAWMAQLGMDFDPLGCNVFDAFPFLAEQVRAQYRQVFATAEPLVSEEHNTVNGWELVTETRKIPVVEAGQVARVVTVVRDMTEAVNARERLRQGEKMEALGQLAGGIAHDFNNQLAGMLGYAELLARRLQDPELREYARMIARGATRSADLTRQLLAFARKGKVRSDPVDIHALIAEIAALLQRTIDRRIELRQRLSATRHVVPGDAGRLQNALLNLAINARDAMPHGGVLTFATDDVAPAGEQGVPFLRIAVEDTGIGMGDEVKRRLFEPFFTTKPLGQGTGMGLATVYATLTDHQGVIRVSSAPGQGSIFTVELPLVVDGQPDISRPAPQPSPAACASILLADDEADVRGALSALLRQLGHTVTECADGDEALREYRSVSSDYDLVMLDVFMPRLDGCQTLRAMRQVDPSVRAILLSGNSVEGQMADLLGTPRVRFLAKPFTFQELADCVTGMLGQKGS